jgi:hypothetical protein
MKRTTCPTARAACISASISLADIVETRRSVKSRSERPLYRALKRLEAAVAARFASSLSRLRSTSRPNHS